MASGDLEWMFNSHAAHERYFAMSQETHPVEESAANPVGTFYTVIAVHCHSIRDASV